MQTDGTLLVPDVPTVPYITGDGVGAEVTPAMQAVVDAAIRKAYGGKRRIEWKEVLAGERAFNATGSWLPDETMETFQEYLVGIKGPLTTPVGGGIRSLNVALRQTLDLYVCLRPVRWYQGVQSPVKSPEKVNMCVFRENTEDIYAGIEWEAGTPEAEKFYQFLKDEMGVTKVRFPETSSFGVKPVSREGTERLVRAACQYAIDHHLPSVTLVHKGNIMKFTEGGFKKWGYELATCSEKIPLEQFGIQHNRCIDDTLIAKIAYNDSALMKFLGYEVVSHFGKEFGAIIPDGALEITDTMYLCKKKDNKDKGQRQFCGCIVSKDIGQYNTCPHLCEYCYANSSKATAVRNWNKHKLDPFNENILGKGIE